MYRSRDLSPRTTWRWPSTNQPGMWLTPPIGGKGSAILLVPTLYYSARSPVDHRRGLQVPIPFNRMTISGKRHFLSGPPSFLKQRLCSAATTAAAKRVAHTFAAGLRDLSSGPTPSLAIQSKIRGQSSHRYRNLHNRIDPRVAFMPLFLYDLSAVMDFLIRPCWHRGTKPMTINHVVTIYRSCTLSFSI